MAIFGGKDEIIEENFRLKAKVEVQEERENDYKEQIQELKQQVTRLQDALIAKEAPEAYQDARAERAEVREVSEEEKERLRYRQEQGKANRRLLEHIEEDLFTDPDDFLKAMTGKNANDLLDLLQGPKTQGTPEGRSVHGNEES